MRRPDRDVLSLCCHKAAIIGFYRVLPGTTKLIGAALAARFKVPDSSQALFLLYSTLHDEDAAVLVLPPGSKAAIVERRYLCRKITRITIMRLHDGVERDLTNLYD